MVVNLVENRSTEHLRDASTHPVTASVGVAPCQVHAGDVFATKVRVHVEDHRVHVDAILAATGLDIMRGDGVPEATTPKVNADPDAEFLIMEDVNVVVAAANGSELPCGFS